MTTQIKQNISYRAPRLDEIVATQMLFFKILESSFPQFTDSAKEAYKKSWSEKTIKSRIETGSDLLLLAWHDDKPIGLVSGTIPEGGVGTIIWLLVAPEYRNKQVGSELLHRASQYYEQLGCHKLKLTAPSEKAKDYYIKQGMQVEGVHRQHWWKLDFWSLSLLLSSE